MLNLVELYWRAGRDVSYWSGKEIKRVFTSHTSSLRPDGKTICLHPNMQYRETKNSALATVVVVPTNILTYATDVWVEIKSVDHA